MSFSTTPKNSKKAQRAGAPVHAGASLLSSPLRRAVDADQRTCFSPPLCTIVRYADVHISGLPPRGVMTQL